VVHERQAGEFLTAARALQRQPLVLEVDSERDFETAFTTLVNRGAGALLISSNPLFDNDKLAILALRHAVPPIYQWREFAEAGGLMSYGANQTDAFRLAGLYVGQILKGAKPADLPFQQSNKLELVINLKTAKTLGLTVPTIMQMTVDDVIERGIQFVRAVCCTASVRSWHKADVPRRPLFVRFWGKADIG
jgi:putative ABC transport system substrate-binding protein